MAPLGSGQQIGCSALGLTLRVVQTAGSPLKSELILSISSNKNTEVSSLCLFHRLDNLTG